VCNDHFDIRNFLFDILRFKEFGKPLSPKPRLAVSPRHRVAASSRRAT